MRIDIVGLQKERIMKFFSNTAGEYKKKYFSERFNFQNFTFLARRKNLILLLAKQYYKNGGRFKRFLDIGCGTGDYLVELLKFAEEVTGADYAQGMLLVAGRSIKGYEQRIKLSQEDIESLSFPNNYFDAVICAGVLEYLCDETQALKEIYRVLKPSGCAYITFPNKFSPFMQLDKIYSFLLHLGGEMLAKLKVFEFIAGRKRVNAPHTIHHAYSPLEIRQRIRHLGFKYGGDLFSSYGSFYVCSKIPYYHILADKLEYVNKLPLLRYGGLNYIVQIEK